MYVLRPQEQFDKANALLFDILAPFECSMVAELTGELNVHFHGLIELKNIEHKSKLLNKFRGFGMKMWGRKTCDQVVFLDSYKKYMRKSLDETRKLIKDPIVRDTFGVFSMQTFDDLQEHKDQVLKIIGQYL